MNRPAPTPRPSISRPGLWILLGVGGVLLLGVLFALGLALGHRLWPQDTQEGVVIEVQGEQLTIAVDGAREGDAVAIYFRIPGIDEPALVGSGTVLAVSGNTAVARIDQRSGDLVVGQIARVGGPAARPASA